MHIDAKKWLLTANNRLARALHQQYDQQQAALGKPAWHTPNILPWSAWLQQQYATLTDTGFNQRILLNTHQEKLLWEQIVKQHNPELLRPQSAARSAQQAWQLMHGWQLPPQVVQSVAHEEVLIFLQWQAAFREHCAQHQFITQAELADLCLQGLQENALDWTNPIELVGFDDISPQQQALLDHLPIEQAEPRQPAAQVQHIGLDTAEDEIHAAAYWAKQQLAQNPQRRIGIVSLNLRQQRSQISHILRQVINPHSLLPGASGKLDFNLSLGQPLAGYPLVAHLLLALQLGQPKPLALQDISIILRSPFIGGHSSEWAKRATLDFMLHDEGLPQLTPKRLINKAQAAGALDLHTRLQALQDLVKQLPKQATPNAWSGHLLAMFGTLGWPGGQSLDSSEYQQAERLRKAISEFACLGLVKPHLSLSGALSQLRQLCEDTLFQPEASNSQLSVLGVLEAAGMPFDALWLLGMDDRQWPPAANPNPLLPIRLQREHALPHASSARELDYATQLTQRLQHSARQVIASHARQDGDQQQNASALVRAWPETSLQALGIAPDATLYRAASHPGTTSALPAPEAIPPSQAPGGGSHLLSAQSACPFQAIARFRLQAQALPATQAAPDARLNGQILHRLLQAVWQSIQDSGQLHRLDEAALKNLIKPQAKSTLRDLGRRRPDVFTPVFIQLEAARLTDLIAAWLQQEKQRGAEFRVLALEERESIELNGLPLHLQADRVDVLEDGSLVVIDYKSGRVSTPDWQDERPDDLQLPLYCIRAEQPVAALVAQVNSKQSRFHGMAAHGDIAPGIQGAEEWEALLAHWRRVLDTLAGEIQQGRADIAPKNDKACVYCGMQPLCRIQAASQ